MFFSGGGGKLKIVVAEDEGSIREILKEILEHPKVAGEFLDWVKIFSNGKEAWDYVRENPVINVIFSDVDMPEMNGLEFLEKVKSEFPDIVFICMSGRPDHIPEAERLGADLFLVKPFSIVNIQKIIKDILG